MREGNKNGELQNIFKLKLTYKCKMLCASHMVTTYQKPTVDSQKIKRKKI